MLKTINAEIQWAELSCLTVQTSLLRSVTETVSEKHVYSEADYKYLNIIFKTKQSLIIPGFNT